MKVRFSFDKAAVERRGRTLEDVHRTIKSLFAAHDLPCTADGDLQSIGIPTYVPPTEQYSGTADPIELSSPFAPHIKNFILQKQADGYAYTLGERTLYRFDRHCVELGITEPILTRDLALERKLVRQSGVYRQSRR